MQYAGPLIPIASPGRTHDVCIDIGETRMNKTWKLIAVASTLLCLAYQRPAYSVGLGGYISGSGGKDWHKSGALYVADYYGLKHRYMKASGSVAYGAGLMMDTDPDSNGIFNYRLNLGYDRANVLATNRIDLNRVNLINTFGFRLFRNDTIKLWLGPQFGINYWWGNESRVTHDMIVIMPPLLSALPVSFQRKYQMIGGTGGIALGTNINLGGSVTLSIEAGCRGYLNRSLKPIEGNPPSGNINAVEGYLSFGVLGRVN
jgi:hypothetical protein